ncbi:carboxylate-amine ligase [Kineococcus rubinsiae]|uniref:carboxylate-amine ligase n=1 Tax=Kineococcus rubinsiae TaxID=2609562 RepID=UPI001430C46E|nr:glutamate--cysteine ligase [Kineococcus rubinsiae]
MSGTPLPGPVGATLGVEEEYHLVDRATLALRDDPRLNAEALAGRLGPRISAEIGTTQIEIGTAVCRTLAEVRADLASARAEAWAAVEPFGVLPLPASTHPWAGWEDQRVTPRPRYLDLVQRWGLLALQQVICGCHVHVGVPSLDVAVAVLDRVRPYLPVLLAMTGSSPFHEGTDTGYDSYRTQWFARWPITGAPEQLGDAQGFRDVVESLRVAGVVDDASHLYWDARPSLRYPTLEFRVADVCPRLDDAVLHAALCRSLTRVLARRAEAGTPVPALRPETLRAARWRAARHGLSDSLVDPGTGALVPAPAAVRGLLAELRDDLTDAGEFDEVAGLVERLLADGTSATRQRAALHRSGDLAAATRAVLRDAGPPDAGARVPAA